jgi:antitoxin component YwqK of YwqJK toxin-antitoxin module
MSCGKFCLEKEYTMRTEYYKDGTPCECEEMGRRYYKSGALAWEAPYIKNKRHGVEKEYYESGIIASEIPFEKDVLHGTKKEYYESGALMFQTTFVNGMRHGIARKYWKSGALAWENLWLSYLHKFDPMENFL